MAALACPAMHHPIAQELDALAGWRADLLRRVGALEAWLREQDLLDDAGADQLASLRARLAADKLVLAFVAEFSRGKSELINAMLFADTGRRVLPATPGRTTMCPVELRCDAGVPAQLALLPIETRTHGLTLAELRDRAEHWQTLPLQPQDPEALAAALAAVTRTQRVTVEQARALGLWRDDEPDDNPPQAEDGSVEVPAWRHAIIQYPHPLLQAGLVVLDTPGLNAIGAEPELTLALLPAAHAAVFLLAADSGVTRSDLAVWREHLAPAGLERFVVLNKIDTLADPLLKPDDVAAQVARQQRDVAATLAMPVARVFPLSAREALAARVAGDAAGLHRSGLQPLEQALSETLLPQRRELLQRAVDEGLARVQKAVDRQVVDRRRQQAEQLLELRGLRGKSSAKLRLMAERAMTESADFERCTARLAALRAVQQKQLRSASAPLSADALRGELGTLQATMAARPLALGARAAFDALLARLRQALGAAGMQADEMRQMLEASFARLNAEFGFALSVPPPPSLGGYQAELDRIAQRYGRYLGLGQAWRLAMPGFAEQFRRMLLSKLRMVFENAVGELELWNKAATSQVETQLRERRKAHARRAEMLQRVQLATDELEARIAEVDVQDAQLLQLQARLAGQVSALRQALRAQAQPPSRDAA